VYILCKIVFLAKEVFLHVSIIQGFMFNSDCYKAPSSCVYNLKIKNLQNLLIFNPNLHHLTNIL